MARAVFAVLMLAAGLATAVAPPAHAAPGQISTIAGASQDRGLATNIVQFPWALAGSGHRLYISDLTRNVVRVLDTETWMEDIAAGTGEEGFSGDGGPATAAKLAYVGGLAISPAGELYLSDTANHRVRKIDSLGNISTVVGTGATLGPTGDGGPAGNAQIASPAGLAFDAAGQLYIAESGGQRVRRVSTLGIITTVAGNGERASTGDGGSAVAASVFTPNDVAVDSQGQLYIAESCCRVRKVDASGRITTAVGTGEYGYGGDGGPATSARIYGSQALAFDTAGNLLLGDAMRVRRVDSAGTITTVAGTNLPTYNGDGGPATAASLIRATGLHVDESGAMFIGDADSGRLRRVDAEGIINTVAGFHGPGSPGDGGPAADAQMWGASAMATDRGGNLYLAFGVTVRRIDRSGIITTVAGSNLHPGLTSGDGGPAVDADITGIDGLAIDLDGTMYMTDAWGVRRVDQAGIITRVAGIEGRIGFSGDGGPASAATFEHPRGLALDGKGNVYVADNRSLRVRRIDSSGRITTVAGNGVSGIGGDGGPATAAPMILPGWVAVSRSGDLWITDANRLRKVSPAGVITTVGTYPGGTSAPLTSIAFDGADVPFVTSGSAWAPVVSRVTPTGGLVTVAGNGTRGSSGDGGPATAASLTAGTFALGPNGDLYIGDKLNFRVRKVESVGAPRRDVVATGYNGFGQLGTGSPGDRRTPALVGGARGARSVAVGGLHSLSVGADATVWAWGWNGFGALGSGNTLDSGVPRKVPGLDRVTAVSAGLYHSLALRDDGTVWAWGWNGYGQLGDGTVTQRQAPVRVPGLTNVRAIAAGGLHSLALLADGTVRAWGFNQLGQLGDGSTVDRRSPVPVPLTGVTSVAAGLYHSLSVQADGTARAWGWNAVGQLGDGTVTDRSAPVPVIDLPPVARLASGSWYHSAALATDGTVWAWGWNDVGQLGDGSVTPRTVPRQVPGLGGVKVLGSGALHTIAIDGAGAVQAWGWNGFGQLGDGTTTDRHTPVPSHLGPATTAAAGPFHSLSATPGG